MRAAVYMRAGEAHDVLTVQHTKAPSPSRRDLLVRVIACSVNVMDTKLRKVGITGIVRPLPKTPGCDIAGFVERAPRGSKFDPGDRVFAMLPQVHTTYGGCAELAAVPERFAARAPAISLVEAASLPLVALTIVQGVDDVLNHPSWRAKERSREHERDQEPCNALVQAGSGGLGTFAIQYCSNELGMRVWTTCSTSNMDFVRSLGASHVVDYTNEDFTYSVSLMDLVIDPLAYLNEKRTWESNVLAPGGHYVSIASSSWEQTRGELDPCNLAPPEARPDRVVGERLRGFKRNTLSRLSGNCAWHHGPVFVRGDCAGLERVRRLVDEGKVAPQVECVYGLDEIADAHAHVESGKTRGKVVVQIMPEY